MAEQLAEITGLSVSDAQFYLRRVGGDVTAAVNLYFEDPTRHTRPPTPPNPARPNSLFSMFSELQQSRSNPGVSWREIRNMSANSGPQIVSGSDVAQLVAHLGEGAIGFNPAQFGEHRFHVMGDSREHADEDENENDEEDAIDDRKPWEWNPRLPQSSSDLASVAPVGDSVERINEYVEDSEHYMTAYLAAGGIPVEPSDHDGGDEHSSTSGSGAAADDMRPVKLGREVSLLGVKRPAQSRQPSGGSKANSQTASSQTLSSAASAIDNGNANRVKGLLAEFASQSVRTPKVMRRFDEWSDHVISRFHEYVDAIHEMEAPDEDEEDTGDDSADDSSSTRDSNRLKSEVEGTMGSGSKNVEQERLMWGAVGIEPVLALAESALASEDTALADISSGPILNALTPAIVQAVDSLCATAVDLKGDLLKSYLKSQSGLNRWEALVCRILDVIGAASRQQIDFVFKSLVSPQPASPASRQSDDDSFSAEVKSMTVKQLRERLNSCHIDHSACVERADLEECVLTNRQVIKVSFFTTGAAVTLTFFAVLNVL